MCGRFDVDVATAALQYSLRDERIASTIVGIGKPARLPRVMDSAAAPLPPEFWEELDALVPAWSAWLDHNPAA